MRIVMLTDDGKSVDRRILLEAEALIDEGHEVIVVARQDGNAPMAERLGRVKVMWIGLDLGYLGGAYDDLKLESQSLVETADSYNVKLRRLMVSLGSALMTSELDLDRDKALIEKGSLNPFRRLGLKLRFRGKSAKHKMIRRFWEAAAQRYERMIAHDAKEFAKLPEMNIWEKSLFFRTLYLDPDVIHVHDLPQLLAGVYAKKVLGVPLVYDAHEVYPQISTLTEEEKDSLHLKEQALLRYCDINIIVNHFCSRLMEYCYLCEPFNIILNATEARAPAGAFKGRLRARLQLPQDAKILMYQGWIADVGRGLTELVEAFRYVRQDVHLVMMGYGDVDAFARLAKDAAVDRRVHILPPVPWDELVSWSAEADAGIIPYQPVDFNHRVCSPNKLFEFIAARLPIICNDLPFLREVVEGEGFGVVHAMSSPKEMAHAINLAFDPEARLIEKAREALNHKGAGWEWSVEAKKLRDIYARIPLPERYKGLPKPPRATIALDNVLGKREALEIGPKLHFQGH